MPPCPGRTPSSLRAVHHRVDCPYALRPNVMHAMSLLDPMSRPGRRYPRGAALVIVDTCRALGVAFADWCVSDSRDAVWGHLELADREAVLGLVQRLARLQTPIEIDIVAPAHHERGRWSVKLRAGRPAGGVLGVRDDAGTT